MNLRDVYRNGRFGLSFEVFPPKTADGDAALATALQDLAKWRPSFISCTYGAGGSTSKRTLEWCRTIQDRFSIPSTAHLTCIETDEEELRTWLASANDAGITNIMALRGDVPQNGQPTQPKPESYRQAHQLVSLIRQHFPHMGIGVAGYPEKHPEASDAERDLQHLVHKVNAGADAVYTQLFFNNEPFLRFRERLTRTGVTVPIVPGIMPITEYSRIVRITSLCGSVIPTTLASRLESVKDDPAAQFEIGVEYSIQQCRDLLREGIAGIHFYALNKSQACQKVLTELRLPA